MIIGCACTSITSISLSLLSLLSSMISLSPSLSHTSLSFNPSITQTHTYTVFFTKLLPSYKFFTIRWYHLLVQEPLFSPSWSYRPRLNSALMTTAEYDKAKKKKRKRKEHTHTHIKIYIKFSLDTHSFQLIVEIPQLYFLIRHRHCSSFLGSGFRFPESRYPFGSWRARTARCGFFLQEKKTHN